MMQHTDTTTSFNVQQLMSDIAQLTKLRLAFSVVFSSLAGYLLAVESIQFDRLMFLLVGGFAIVGASNAFNQWIEKEQDGLMLRTQNRPLPSGRMSEVVALSIATVLAVFGLLMLYQINVKTTFFAAFSIFVYTCIYTPLKSKTPLAVFVGAFPGAIPFMLGWVAATNQFGIEPGILFMIQFFWQFPHFWAIGWFLDEDYKRAGYKMLPSGNTDQATAFQIVFYALWTIITSILPVFAFTGALSLSITAMLLILLLGGLLLFYCLVLMKQQSKAASKKLILVSIVYITGLQIIYVIDKFIAL